MKQLLFFLLFPCLALAQYQGNANQKITLGEQTTADGLVYRGVASIDTVSATSKITRANKQDTSAYLLLDTVTNLLWHYKIGSNAWTQAGGGVSVSSFSAGTTGLTPSTATTGAVTLGGTLAVANGGTNTSTAFTAGSVVFAGASGTYTQDNSGLFYDNTNDRLGIGTTSPGAILEASQSTNGDATIKITNSNAGVNATAQFFADNGTNRTQFFHTGNGYTTGGSQVVNYANLGGIYNQSTGIVLSAAGASGVILFGTGSFQTERMRITSGGNVGIGTMSPQSGYRLHVVDSVYVGGNVSASAYTTRSDYDLKDEIQNISYGINEVMQMQPVKYTYKSNGSTQLGFIAQDLGVITPEVVSFEDKMSVYYNALIPILTKAIQEQQTLIKALEQRILNLENK